MRTSVKNESLIHMKYFLIGFFVVFLIISLPCSVLKAQEKKESQETVKEEVGLKKLRLPLWQLWMIRLGVYAPSLKSIYVNNQGVTQIEKAFEELKKRKQLEAQEQIRQRQEAQEKGEPPPSPGNNSEEDKEESGFTNEEYDKILFAYDYFLEAVGESPMSPEYHLNLGVVNELRKNEDNAYKEYQTALKLSPPQSVFAYFSLFNMARMKAQQSQTEEALMLYIKALEINPDSKEVRNNIELLWQSQQGQGKGKGNQDQKDKDKNKDQSDEDKDQNEKKEPKNENKNHKYEYSGKNLTKDQIKKILEEIKNQEQKIRAKQNKKGKKEQNPDKDW